MNWEQALLGLAIVVIFAGVFWFLTRRKKTGG